MAEKWTAAIAAGGGLVAAAAVRGSVQPGYDLGLYKRMAAVAAAGHDPYVDRYADFPPLKMLAFEMLHRAGAHAWPAALAAIAGLEAALLIMFLRRRYPGQWWPLLAALPGVLPVVFFPEWYGAWEDKPLYALLTLAILLALPAERGTPVSVRRAIGAGLLVGLLQAWGGAGLLALPICVMAIPGRAQRRALVAAGALLLTVSHLSYWPDWIAGYQHRAARMSGLRPMYASFWRLVDPLGVYTGHLTAVTVAAAIAAVWWLFATRRIEVGEAVALAAAVLLLVGPDTGYDRVMAGFVPLIAVCAHRKQVTLLALGGVLVAGLSPGAPPVAMLAVVWAIILTLIVAAIANRRATSTARTPRPPESTTHCSRFPESYATPQPTRSA